ncbi:MAG: hypothetical protein ABR568_20040 [Pyrinomonadaceae bacterium]
MTRNLFVPICLLSLLTTLEVAPITAKTLPALKLQPHRIVLANGRSFDLNLPEGFAIRVAAQGLKRVRFLAKSPDDRIFVTDMYDLSDNKRGVVYILAEFDPDGKTFKKVISYLTGLRNPNSIAFYTDQQGVNWFYLALTDRFGATCITRATRSRVRA